MPELIEGAVPDAKGPTKQLPLREQRAQMALETLQWLIADEGKALPKGKPYPDGLKGVSMGIWRERFKDKLANDPEKTVRQNSNLKNQAFTRAQTDLQANRQVTVHNELAWSAGIDLHGLLS